MDNKNRPQSRQKNVTSGGSGVHRRGSGLGTGKVGNKSYSSSSSGRRTGSSGSSGSSHSSGGGRATRAAGGGGGLVIILIIVFMLIRNGGIGGFLDSGSSGGNSDYGGGNSGGSSGYSASYEARPDTSVASGSRDKYTNILGGGRDTVTLMVYICGTDLESKHGMASSDMEEMRAASKNFGDNFNLIVYTGGCNQWKNDGISSKVNQIYQIKDGSVTRLVKDDGNKAMTDPATLTSFIKYCAENFPANRNELILWDHGGGSVSGYGYDEKNSGKGSMNLAGIDKALKNGGVKFDFVGFDACLMATAENALMLNSHADYLIASEETEPGIGWYYTNWLNKFASDTSMSTVDIGKNIIDDFVEECGIKCRGQKTTLSIIDLAEFSNTVPADLTEFSKSLSGMIAEDNYKTVSDARYATREFASSSKIDQIDLVNFADNMNTAEGRELSRSLRNAVKYNRTSSNMTNAYGVSIYFPYKRTSYVDKACNTYEQIGMDSEYAECIRQFAKVETSGQIAAGGSSSPAGSLLGSLGAVSSASGSSDVIGQLLTSFLAGTSDRAVNGLDGSNTSFMNGADNDGTAEYIASNRFDPDELIWVKKDGKYVMTLPESQWDMVHSLDKNMFYFDGEGWVDLGTDNLFSFDDDGNLIADTDKDWLSINGQPVAYYHTDTVEENGKTLFMGYVPAFLNGQRVKLIIVLDESGNGYIAGASYDYENGETETVAKNLTELNAGDKLDFICDFYSDKAGREYLDSYYLGEQMTVTDDMKITNTAVGSGEVRIMYCFTDIYDREYWSEAITVK